MTIKGQTHVLAITDKETTGPPHFVEIGIHNPPYWIAKLRVGLKRSPDLQLRQLV